MEIKNRNIFLIGTRWFGVIGQSKILIDELKKNSINVFIFGQKDNYYHQFKIKGVFLKKLRVKASYFAPISDILDILKIIFYIIKYNPIAIHTFNPKPALLGYFSILLFKNIKLFIAQTGMGNIFSKKMYLIPFISFLLRKATIRSEYVFFHNRYDANLLLEKKIITEEKIVYIGPCVDVKNFLKDSRINKKNYIQVICIARLLKQKGVIEFIEVAKKFKDQLNKETVKFLLIGEIETHHYDKIDKDYILQAEAGGVINRIPWTDDVKTYLHQSDILFLHSYREGGPRVIIEAAASEIPTVGSDAIGVRDLIINNKTGFITELKNIELAFAAVNELINNKNKREEFGKNALNLIAKPISLEKATEVQIKYYLKTNLFS